MHTKTQAVGIKLKTSDNLKKKKKDEESLHFLTW